MAVKQGFLEMELQGAPGLETRLAIQEAPVLDDDLHLGLLGGHSFLEARPPCVLSLLGRRHRRRGAEGLLRRQEIL